HRTRGVLARDPQGVERGIHDADVRAAAPQREEVAARSGNAQHVAEGGEDDARTARDRVRLVDHLERGDAHGTTGPVHQLDLGWEHPVEPVADDGVRLAAADLHEDPRPRGRLRDAARDPRGDLSVAVLVDVSHGDLSLKSRSAVSSAVWPISSSTRYARSASLRSIREIANPTCTRTYSPTEASGT